MKRLHARVSSIMGLQVPFGLVGFATPVANEGRDSRMPLHVDANIILRSKSGEKEKLRQEWIA